MTTRIDAKQQTGNSTIERVLELARWAPSGDNTQPWRFEIVGDRELVVHGHDTREHCVYDLDGRASQLANGALLETIEIASTSVGARVEATRRPDMPETCPTFDLRLVPDSSVEPSPLVPFVTERLTQRRPMRTESLTDEQRSMLEAAAGPGFSVLWRQRKEERRRMARLLFRSAWIRLTTREAYEVHRSMIQWNSRYSDDRIPDQAVGLDPVALKLMRWALGSWQRVRFMNRYLMGTLVPRIQLDYLPAMRCGAHFFIVADHPPRTIDDFVAGGRAMQRFWLTATKLGLLLQPEMTPLIFSRYVRQGLEFCESLPARRRAEWVAQALAREIGGEQAERAVFMGRLGGGVTPTSRSTRLPLPTLLATATRER